MNTRELYTTLRASVVDLHAGRQLSGATVAELTIAIASHEIQPGGPYASQNVDISNEALNTAIAEFLTMCGIQLPTLCAYVRMPQQYSATEKPLTYGEANMYEHVRSVLRTRIAEFPEYIQTRILNVIEQTINGNPDHQMTLMPYYVRQALGSKGSAFSDDEITQLGLMNVFFWTAFIIYDDFWDEDEKADPALLPIANTFAREFISYFSMRSDLLGFERFFHTHMGLLDAANEWEITHCRMAKIGNSFHVPDTLPDFGSYERKFYPAVGHVFGPVMMLLRIGYELESREVKKFVEYFSHYLIAMQLNDDLHDWKEDLARGHISTTIAPLLAVWKTEHPDQTALNIYEYEKELEHLFWFRILEPQCEKVLRHAALAREALYTLSLFEDYAPLEKFIQKNEAAAQKALAECELSREFLRALMQN